MKKQTNGHWRGTGLITLSAVFFASYGVWSRLMQTGLGEFSQAWTRAAFLLPILIIVGAFTKQFKPIQKADWRWFFLIGSMGALNQAPYYYAFAHLPVGLATLLFYSGLTLGGYIIGALFFKELLTKIKLTSLGLALIGLVVMFGQDFNSTSLLPIVASVAAGIMGATAIVFSKKLSSNYSELQTIMSYLVLMLPANLILSQIFGESLPAIANLAVWLPAIGYALSFMFANLTVVAGFRYLEPSVGALIGLSEVVLAGVYGLILFADQLTTTMLIGSAIVLLAIALPELTKFKQR